MKKILLCISLFYTLCLPQAQAADTDTARLVAKMKGQTPIFTDLKQLADEIGGRPTGSSANAKAVLWAEQKFKDIGVNVTVEPFDMPRFWLENQSSATVTGPDVRFTPRVVAMPFSTGTDNAGLKAPLLNGGTGAEADIARLGTAAKGAWVLIQTPVLDDAAGLNGLFREYMDAIDIEQRLEEARVAGLIYMSSRRHNLLYRHLSSKGAANKLPILVMEREEAQRAQRLLQGGKALSFSARINVEDGPTFTAYNVIGEIKGASHPEEIVLIGAHLDSFDLGTGALDNGSNVSMVIDIARQITALGLKPRRTIRFALWNGEEQGLYGSFGYTKRHAAELDHHVMAASYDMGTGKISGFFLNGRDEFLPALNNVLEPVADLGPFTHINHPVVGTDNFDFMMQGVANLVAAQDSANYASNYHAQSDTFDKVNQAQLKLNSAIAAAVTFGLADREDISWKRHTAEKVKYLVDSTDLPRQMKAFGIWQDWLDNKRGIKHD
ncbi:M28 family peptidase [Paremcibacter congregatus]|uniref:M28 family peptidase n=1 Tax=Paremcibacter congregatus TaxID=2043170 RepID=UPI0030EE9B4D